MSEKMLGEEELFEKVEALLDRWRTAVDQDIRDTTKLCR